MSIAGLVGSAYARTVTVTNENKDATGVTTSVDLAFSADSATHALWMAYGKADGGDSFDGWENVSHIGKVAGDVTSMANVSVPDNWGTSVYRFRFFLASPDAVPVATLDYIEATGSQYVKTSFKPNCSSAVEMSFAFDPAHTNEQQTLFCARKGYGQAAMLRLFRFLRRQPGFEKIRIVSHAAEVGVRETTRVRGDYVITLDDYVTGRVWPDSLCYVFYPVDVHVKGKGVVPQDLPVGVIPTVPLRALLPKGIDHMLMAGRCLSADRLAMSGIRVQAACMATGQSAGEAAALAARTGYAPRNLDPEEIKAGFRARGCIVP